MTRVDGQEALRVAVVGGNFGRLLAAASVRAGARVDVISRSSAAVPAGVTLRQDYDAVVDAQLVIVAVPSTHIELVASRLADYLHGRHRVVHVGRGLVDDDLTTMCEVIAQRTACPRVGVLAGPLSRGVLLHGASGAAVIGSDFPDVIATTRRALSSPTLQIHGSQDVAGVELCAAVSSLVMFALGLATGKGWSPSSRAALATRGLDELARIGAFIGAKQATFLGLAGVGDIAAVLAGETPPEFQLGAQIAAGMPCADAAAELGTNVEILGVARVLVEWGRKQSVSVPLASTICELLDEAVEVDALLKRWI